MPTPFTSIRINTELLDRATTALGARSRTEAIHMALEEVVGLQNFKDLMAKSRGELSFDICGE